MKYTDPTAYDGRTHKPEEKYIHSLWDAILRKTINKYISTRTTVCDLGCGTLEHTQHMSMAARIIAIDTSTAMLEGGQPKIAHLQHKITLLAEDALHTSLPASTCDVIWTVGLSEYVNLNELWQEISRLAKNPATVIIQFPNKQSSYNLIISSLKYILGQKSKQFRTLQEMDSTAGTYGWRRRSFISCGMILPLPASLAPLGTHIWPILEKICAPLQAFYPIGLNVLAVYERRGAPTT